MSKLLLMSVLVATISIPIWTSRDKKPRRAYRRAITGMLVFNTLYMLALRIVYPYLD